MTFRRTISAMGLAVTPPFGWEASIYRRAPEPGELTHAVVHAATVPLVGHRADYGGGVVETLGPWDLFVAIVEFDPSVCEQPLFRQHRGIPGLGHDDYGTRQLQRNIRGQGGAQRFFNTGGRAFCLYSVIGSYANRMWLSARANELIGSFRVEKGHPR